MKINIKVLVSAIIIVIIFFGVGVYHFQQNKWKSKEQYAATKIKREKIVETISSSGQVKPKNRLELKPPVTGRLEKLLVEEGDRVEKGEIIGEYSASERVALIDTARTKGEKEMQKWMEIYKAIPLVAPITGTIISRLTEPGQTLTVSDGIVTISDKLVINAQVDETDVAKISKGQKVQIILDAYPDKKIMGEVQLVAYEATTSDNVTVYDVDINPINSPEFMKSGMSVEVIFFIQEKKDALVLPSEVVLYDEQGAYLYEKIDSGYQKLHFKTGIQNDGWTEIIGNEISEGSALYTKIISFSPTKQQEKSSNPFMPARPGHQKKTK